MATTVTTSTAHGTTTLTEPGPAVAEAFVADRQAFWNGFTRFATFGVVGIVVLLILMAIFLV